MFAKWTLLQETKWATSGWKRHNWLMLGERAEEIVSIWWSVFHVCSCEETFCSWIFRNFPSVLTLSAFLTGYVFHQFFDNGLLVREEGNALVLRFDLPLFGWLISEFVSISVSISILLAWRLNQSVVFEFKCAYLGRVLKMQIPKLSLGSLDSLGLGYIFTRNIAFNLDSLIIGCHWCAQPKGL